MKLDKTLFVSILFSIPDTEIFGIRSYTILLIILIYFLSKSLNSIYTEFIRINAPYIFLIFYSVFVVVFYFKLNFSFDELRFIITKNVELITELFICYFLIYSPKNIRSSFERVKKFIKVYFTINIAYIILGAIYTPLKKYFHVSVGEIALLDTNREFFLGYEPSYSIPLMLLLYLIYGYLSGFKLKFNLYTLITIYGIITGGSKTAYIMIAAFLIFYFLSKIINLNRFIMISTIPLLSIIFIFNGVFFQELKILLGVDNFQSLDKIDQYEVISLVTRLESIQYSIQLIGQNIFGLGIGNSIIVLSKYLQSTLAYSFEIKEAIWTALTPKSQFLEYILSGGLIFLTLFLKQLKDLYKAFYIDRDNYALSCLLLITIVFIIGERLPYIVLFGMMHLMTKYNKLKMV